MGVTVKREVMLFVQHMMTWDVVVIERSSIPTWQPRPIMHHLGRLELSPHPFYSDAISQSMIQMQMPPVAMLEPLPRMMPPTQYSYYSISHHDLKMEEEEAESH